MWNRSTKVVLPAVVVTVFVVGLWVALDPFREPQYYGAPYYRTLRIDTQTFHAQLANPYPEKDQKDAPRAEYYSTFHFMAHLGIYHYDGRKNLPYQVRLNAFDADLDKRVVSRSKVQELFRGVSGTLYAMTKYFYGSPKGTNSLKGSKFEVTLYRSNAEHEPPQLVANLPDPSPPLSAISVIRVFQMPPDHGVVIANYDGSGTLKGANIFASRGGDWDGNPETAPEIRKEAREFLSNLRAAVEKYGIPDQFPIADYLKNKEWTWKDVGRDNPENVVNLHYDHNRWVRQEIFDAKGERNTRYLTYVWTPEDEMLKTIDREFPFGQTN